MVRVKQRSARRKDYIGVLRGRDESTPEDVDLRWVCWPATIREPDWVHAQQLARRRVLPAARTSGFANCAEPATPVPRRGRRGGVGIVREDREDADGHAGGSRAANRSSHGEDGIIEVWGQDEHRPEAREQAHGGGIPVERVAG